MLPDRATAVFDYLRLPCAKNDAIASVTAQVARLCRVRWLAIALAADLKVLI